MSTIFYIGDLKPDEPTFSEFIERVHLYTKKINSFNICKDDKARIVSRMLIYIYENIKSSKEILITLITNHKDLVITFKNKMCELYTNIDKYDLDSIVYFDLFQSLSLIQEIIH